MEERGSAGRGADSLRAPGDRLHCEDDGGHRARESSPKGPHIDLASHHPISIVKPHGPDAITILRTHLLRKGREHMQPVTSYGER